MRVNTRYINSTRGTSSWHTCHVRVLLMCLCDIFRVLINSLVCWFCASTLGCILFQIFAELQYQICDVCFILQNAVVYNLFECMIDWSDLGLRQYTSNPTHRTVMSWKPPWSGVLKLYWWPWCWRWVSWIKTLGQYCQGGLPALKKRKKKEIKYTRGQNWMFFQWIKLYADFLCAFVIW